MARLICIVACFVVGLMAIGLSFWTGDFTSLPWQISTVGMALTAFFGRI